MALRVGSYEVDGRTDPHPLAGVRPDFTVWDGPVRDGLLGFRDVCFSGGGQDRRAALFAGYAGGLRDTFAGLFDMSAEQAWAEANELVESPDVYWVSLRVDPSGGRTFYRASGSC
ncbi:hypothetical protein [Actinophytocola sp.]|jgi:hypothetical protein|uniref:hypothetical protein n=1 Tax=Actinophytocola sp. TaxID=1872138 RepID=UPI002D7F8149|nr:hypothetical protein [Actinophytocola sp.]HET9140923.1 hypothetical protein [Actinophytocola sp.]